MNNNYAVNPPSVNVATFDGLKEDGFPYVFPVSSPNSTSPSPRGETDYLISKPINISDFDAFRILPLVFIGKKDLTILTITLIYKKGYAKIIFFK